MSRMPAHFVIPALVVAALVLILGWSASETLRPATPIQVHAAIHDTSFDLVVQPRPDDAPRSVRPGSSVTVQAPGWLEADPYYIACAALADGVVDEILVLEGDYVEAGTVVARLVDDDARLELSHAASQVAMAEANVAMAQADVLAAQTDWEHPVERRRAVDAARASLAETEAELAQLPALVDVERAMHERMVEELRRSQKAFESGAVSDIELIIIEKRVEAQKASLDALQRREPILAAKAERLRAELVAAERNAELRIAERQALGRAQAALSRAEAAVLNARTAHDEAALRLERMTIEAPISGYVQRRLKVPGDKVMLGMDAEHSSHLLHLYDPARIQVRVDVPLAEAAHIFVGQTCEVVVDVLPDVTFGGEVTRITHEADLQKNTLQAKVRVIDPSPLLRPEMLTRVKFLPDAPDTGASASPGESQAATLIVPKRSLDPAATVSPGQTAVVWTVRNRRGDAGTAEPVDVEVVSVDAEWVTILANLQPGALVAVDAPRLRAGQRVRMTTYGVVREGASG